MKPRVRAFVFMCIMFGLSALWVYMVKSTSILDGTFLERIYISIMLFAEEGKINGTMRTMLIGSVSMFMLAKILEWFANPYNVEPSKKESKHVRQRIEKLGLEPDDGVKCADCGATRLCTMARCHKCGGLKIVREV